MPTVSFEKVSWHYWAFALLATITCLILSNIVYNLTFHPLARVPGPFWARVSSVPSWYYALRGDRHIWLLQQFEIYGERVRAAPNLVVFRNPDAYAAIFDKTSNVRRSKFYSAFVRKKNEYTILNSVDVAKHAHKRKLLSTIFTDKMVRSASDFVIKHVDRWIDLMVEENPSTSEWSPTVDFSPHVNALIFDINGDLSFGTDFKIKEPGDNPLKAIPHTIEEYMKFYYPMCRSPFLDQLLWLKPRGLDALFELITPPAVQKYNEFVYDSISKRLALHLEQKEQPEETHRKDAFYFLCEAKNPDTGLPAYNEGELRAESSFLIIAGSDTTSISLAGIFFYLTGDPRRCQKLTNEILETFETVDDIVYGHKLFNCKYLKACIDEGMRLTPTGPSELPREILPGGLEILGEYYPEGVIVGSVPWVDSRNSEIYGDAGIFRPERWIVDEAAGVTKEDVARMRSNFHPFTTGARACLGKQLAYSTMMITVARTLHRLELRRTPGSTFGGGSPKMGWGQRDPNQFQLYDAFVSLHKGPEVQFRMRK